MAEKPDQIERHIQSTRDELGNNLHELETKVRNATDWHTYFERNPMALMGLAFGGGVLLATLSGGGKRTRYDVPSTQTRPSAQRAAVESPLTATLENMKGALLGLAAAKVRTLLNDAVPGFAAHYEKTERDALGQADRMQTHHLPRM